jgi:hypothetical protein
MQIIPASACLLFLAAASAAAEPDAAATVQGIVDAAGGRDKLLRLFRITEKLNVSSDPEKTPNHRVSVIEPPDHWWLGAKQRANEPATYLVWVWTLGALVDERSKLESIPDATDAEKPLFGLRISGSITPPLDAYFDKTDRRLAHIDWRGSIHRFSQWKEHDGVKYPSKCIGYRKKSGEPWYFSEIVEVERLKELPAGLER